MRGAEDASGAVPRWHVLPLCRSSAQATAFKTFKTFAPAQTASGGHPEPSERDRVAFRCQRARRPRAAAPPSGGATSPRNLPRRRRPSRPRPTLLALQSAGPSGSKLHRRARPRSQRPHAPAVATARALSLRAGKVFTRERTPARTEGARVRIPFLILTVRGSSARPSDCPHPRPHLTKGTPSTAYA
jgi:hypothetical protein